MDWCLKFQKASHLVVDTTTKSQKRRPQFGSQHRLSSVYIWSISPLQEGILLWPRHTQFAAFMVCQRRQGWKGKTSIASRSFRRQHLNTKRGNGVHNGHGKIFREVDTPLSGGIPAGFVSFVFGLRFFFYKFLHMVPAQYRSLLGLCPWTDAFDLFGPGGMAVSHFQNRRDREEMHLGVPRLTTHLITRILLRIC